jgi:outer membrane protein OmpA-like peptidoglycan-associated protein
MDKVKLTIGLTFGVFSAPLPAQGAAPGPAMVFFDWGKPEIRSDDKAVLDKIAEEWRAEPNSRLLLSGHSDRSGPTGVNLRSSRRRAETVRAYLLEHGVPGTAMTIQAYGEQRPIVPTEDGVREVQNRRVEIRFVPAG